MNTNKPSEGAIRAVERIGQELDGQYCDCETFNATEIARIIEQEVGGSELRNEVKALLDSIDTCQDEDVICCIDENLKKLRAMIG